MARTTIRSEDITAGQIKSADLETNVVIDGDLTVDTDTLYVDSTNNRVGIGTTSPAARLDVIGGLIRANRGGGDSDTSYGALQFAVDGVQHAMIASENSFNLKFITNNSERMRIDSSGRVTMPYQPAFKAAGSAAYTARPTPVDYNTAAFNIGGHYNTSTYRFTAPVSGTYWFGAYALAESTSSNGGINLRVNGSVAIRSYNQANERTRGITIILYLNANDYVDVGTETETTYWLAGYAYFAGYLIS